MYRRDDKVFGGQITPHFTWQEVLHSETAVRYGIENVPKDEETEKRIIATAKHLEGVRTLLGPLKVNSWLRVLLVNRKLGSKDTSQHITGEAVDFVPVRASNHPKFKEALKQAWLEIKRSPVPYDQLILEGTWIHISFKYGWPPRRQAFILDPATGRVTYE